MSETLKGGLLENKQTPANYFIKTYYTEEQKGQTYGRNHTEDFLEEEKMDMDNSDIPRCCSAERNKTIPHIGLSDEELNRVFEEIAEEMRIQLIDKKEAPSMKVTYNNYTGELWKMERIPGTVIGKALYNIVILCRDGAKVSFERVSLDCLRFSGAEVAFGS